VGELRVMGVAGFCGSCVFGCISVVVEGVCVRDCRGLGLYIVGRIG
jgi:hypothetical protein